jgi:hypothetical protein
MLDNKIISKVVDLVQNLRHLGFAVASWEDILAVTGTLSLADKTELSALLIAAGASMSGRCWDFANLSVDVLPTISSEDDRLVTVIKKIPGGTWGKDPNGKWRFIKDVGSEFPAEENENDGGDLGFPTPKEPPRKGKLDLGL